jgi:16S rRNA (uracil1498-N3)-methyltransferase
LDVELAEGVRVGVEGDRFHYLARVMRAGVGDPVRVFNAGCGEFGARVGSVGRHSLELVVEGRRRGPLVEGTGVVLLFAPLKRDATDLVVRMATELGVAVIRPVATARTVAGRVNLERLGAIAREAAEQCERLDVPAVEEIVGFWALLEGWDAGVTIVAAVERSGARLLGTERSGAGALLVGPEGGFAAEELDGLARRPFVQPVSLGPNVLRADTASAVGLALLRLERRVGCDVEPG